MIKELHTKKQKGYNILGITIALTLLLFCFMTTRVNAAENQQSWQGIYSNGEKEIIIVETTDRLSPYVALIYEPGSQSPTWVDIGSEDVNEDKISTLMADVGFSATYIFTRSGDELTYQYQANKKNDPVTYLRKDGEAVKEALKYANDFQKDTILRCVKDADSYKTQISKLSITVPDTVKYTGKALKPDVIIKDGDKILNNGTDYTLSYKNNKKIGKATIIITGEGAYTGRVNKIFKIVKK